MRNSRNYLPHLTSQHLIQHIIIRLSDTLPTHVLKRFEREVEHLPTSAAKQKLIEKIEAWSDAGHGCCVLRNKNVAELVQEALLYHHEIRYRLFAWVIMPNHVHLLLEQLPEWSLNKIVGTFKKRTAHDILKMNPKLLKPLWQKEYWDRYTRNRKNFRQVVNYIHQNPVKAGLVKTPEAWAWSTARTWAAFREDID